MKNEKKQRDSGIELLKVLALVLIIINHVIMTLYMKTTSVSFQDYIINLGISSKNIQFLVLDILKYSGALGNTIFFVCSAWFLVGKQKSDHKKTLQMLLDIWIISVIILAFVFVLKDGSIPFKDIIKQLFPTLFENNWYMTCYITFCFIYPYLNILINNISKKQHLRIVLLMLFVYVGINFVLKNSFFSSTLILWITIYFTIAYLKFYLQNMTCSIRTNIVFLLLGIISYIGEVIITNYVGFIIPFFETRIFKWNVNCNPFCILIAISAFNLFRQLRFSNKVINYLSSLSMLIYIIHENYLLRNYYRPILWQFAYEHFRYRHIVLISFAIVLFVFCFGAVLSILYKETIQKATKRIAQKLYALISSKYYYIEEKLIKQNEKSS
jgi:hypothetical protein